MKSCLEGKLNFKNLKSTSIAFEAGVEVCVSHKLTYFFCTFLVNKITKS